MKQTKNKVIQILNSAERIETQINFIVNTSGVEIGSEKAEKLRERD